MESQELRFECDAQFTQFEEEEKIVTSFRSAQPPNTGNGFGS